MNTSVAQQSTSHNVGNANENRALTLLGSGLGPEVVAQATGVSVSRISQLLSVPEFAAQVSELRFKSLQKHNERDNAYDTMEDTLLGKLKDLLPFMQRPMEVLKAISVINAAKRRGATAPHQENAHTTVVNVVLPAAIIQRFTTNVHNQVITAGTQELLTIQSSNVAGMLSAQQEPRASQEVIQERVRDLLDGSN